MGDLMVVPEFASGWCAECESWSISAMVAHGACVRCGTTDRDCVCDETCTQCNGLLEEPGILAAD